MEGLAELHTHLGGSVASEILWSLAHEQGIALPVKDYWEFDRLVTVSDPRGVANLDALDEIYHWTELIQSSASRLATPRDRKSTRLNSSHITISYAVFCLKKKKKQQQVVNLAAESRYGGV